ncbi:MAG: HAMP domain-containing histidine kinase [Chloroflexaceae bacterium]|jgi:signal transduction histidine kinase|nr:HAMP domain-containing histidine kinase [Chloroflexaceae bacterium]
MAYHNGNGNGNGSHASNGNGTYASSGLHAASGYHGAGQVSLEVIEHLAHDQGQALLTDEAPSRDILIRRAYELAALASYLNDVSHARSEFLSKVSHEIRTPLTVAKGWICLLRDTKLPPEHSRIVEVVEQQIDDLSRLVNDLLDLSRREVGALSLHREATDLVCLVGRVAEHQCELASLQGITLRMQSRVPSVMALVDRVRIAQVLNNMINNACRYVQHFGKGEIELGVGVYDTQVQLSVRDNGIGIAPEHLARIFEPFYQIKNGQRGKSGLGLAVAQEIVHAHGGSLTVESTPGKGTAFHIWLDVLEGLPEVMCDGREVGL